jgi:hypothetical protein
MNNQSATALQDIGPRTASMHTNSKDPNGLFRDPDFLTKLVHEQQESLEPAKHGRRIKYWMSGS